MTGYAVKKKIVSIDDEPMILECLQEALTRRGYEVHTTSDPEEGLRILREEPNIALALLDIKMPGKSGFQIYSEFRRFRKIPVLFVTAYPKSFNAESDHVMEMWKSEFADGMTDIIYKPFDLNILYEKVEGLIGRPDGIGGAP